MGRVDLNGLALLCTQVPLYTAEIVERYVNRGTPRDGSEAPEPHVFLTADTAYKAMCRSGMSQSLVITGESGSGKTETTKIAMQVCNMLSDLQYTSQTLSQAAKLQCRCSARNFGTYPTEPSGVLVEGYCISDKVVVLQTCVCVCVCVCSTWQALLGAPVWRMQSWPQTRSWRPLATPRRCATTTVRALASS